MTFKAQTECPVRTKYHMTLGKVISRFFWRSEEGDMG